MEVRNIFAQRIATVVGREGESQTGEDVIDDAFRKVGGVDGEEGGTVCSGIGAAWRG